MPVSRRDKYGYVDTGLLVVVVVGLAAPELGADEELNGGETDEIPSKSDRALSDSSACNSS